MVEYLYNAIKAVAAQDIKINAIVTDEKEELITTNCSLVLHNDDSELYTAEGQYIEDSGSWDFIIPGEATVGMKGRYWYCIRHENSNLCFKQPIYLV